MVGRMKTEMIGKGNRLGFGIEGLDERLGGGLIPGTLTVIAGATGVGKTQLGLRWADAGREAEGRRGLGYPPFGYLAKLLFQGEDPAKVGKQAGRVAEALRREPGGWRVLGPAPSPIARIQGRHRVQILIKAPSRSAVHGALALVKAASIKKTSGVDQIIDVDPFSML